MGVYEDLLKRKKIIEDKQGSVTVNAVVNKNTRDKLTDNSIQTYQTDQESNKNAMTQMSNILKRTAKSTVWEQMQNIMQNKPINTFSLGNSFRNNLTTSIKKKDDNKNTSLLDDTKGLLKLTGLGASTGTKQTLNYVESANENNFNNYRNLKNKQFLTSKNVSEEEKAIAKSQNNLLLQKNGINTNQNIETNLVKKAIQESIKSDEEKIQEEQSKMSNIATQKLGEIAPSLGQMIPGTVASAINPVLGTTYFTTSAGGSYIDDAKKRGMSDKEAFTYGTIMGALEGASESVITGQQLSKVSKAFTGKQISKKILESYGFNIFENAVQEAVMEPAQEITAGMVGNKADWTDMGKRMAQSGFNGALMGAISNGVTAGLSKSGQIYNKIQNGETITETEYREALQENIDEFGKDVVKESMKNGATEVYQEINNLQPQSIQSQQNNQTQQITQQENKTAQNGISEQINHNKNATKKTINVYHGTTANKDIDNFNISQSGNYGTGIYFSTNEKMAKQFTNPSYRGKASNGFTGKLLERKISVSNPFDATKGFSNKEFEVFKEYAKGINDYNMENIVSGDITINDKNRKLLTNIMLKTLSKNGINTSKIFEGLGYDSIIAGGGNEIVVFNNNQILQENNLANNQQTLYNINNESESDINGQINQRNDGTSRLFEESTEKQREYSWDEYNKWEESIKPTENITNKEQQSINKSKSEYNKKEIYGKEIENSNKSSFSFDKINSKIETDSNINKLTDKGITMTYVHMNNQNTQNFGTTYGQNIEPSGEYMNVDTMQGKYKVPGADYGTIHFKQPLVLDHVNTGETGWKKTLSDMFENKTGKELSNAIKKAGYDGIITIDEDGYYSEVVNINGNKINNIENNQNSLYNNIALGEIRNVPIKDILELQTNRRRI